MGWLKLQMFFLKCSLAKHTPLLILMVQFDVCTTIYCCLHSWHVHSGCSFKWKLPCYQYGWDCHCGRPIRSSWGSHGQCRQQNRYNRPHLPGLFRWTRLKTGDWHPINAMFHIRIVYRNYWNNMSCLNFCKYSKYMHLEREENGCRHGAYGRMGTQRILLTRQLWGAAHWMKLYGASISDSYVFKAAQMHDHSCHQLCPFWRMEIYHFQLQKSLCIL